MAGITAALLGSKRRIAAVAVLSLVAIVAIAVGVGLLGAPGVEAVDNEFGDVNESTTVVETDLVVHNPNPFGVGLDDATVEYTVSMNGVELAEGDREGVAVGTGNTTLAFTSHVDNERIPEWWYRHVERGEESELVVDAEVRSSRLGRGTGFTHDRTVETDVIGEFDSTETRPVNASDAAGDDENGTTIPGADGVLDGAGTASIVDPIMYVNETSGEWGSASPEETPIEVDFVAYNPQVVPYAISELEYEITMNDVPVGEGTSEGGYLIEPHSSERIETTTAIRNDRLDEWWVTHLRNDQVTDLEITFYATVEIEGHSIRVPLTPLDHEETIETDIFEDE